MPLNIACDHRESVDLYKRIPGFFRIDDAIYANRQIYIYIYVYRIHVVNMSIRTSLQSCVFIKVECMTERNKTIGFWL